MQGAVVRNDADQVLPFLSCYRNEYYNSKVGRMEDEKAAAEATGGGTVRG